MPPPERAPNRDVLTLLRDGQMEVKGRLPWSSNGTFLVEVCQSGESMPAVYKPLRGERPLWDYPPGLYEREVAVYVVSEFLGWGLVPETLTRDGPLGVGSVQRFVDARFEHHYFTLLERPEFHAVLKQICLFDLVVNNGDRKAGHCLLDTDNRVWGIDHGLCLHADPKLRTVIWDFAGQTLPQRLMGDVARLADAPPAEQLDALLTDAEIEALARRAAQLVERPLFPAARSARSFPWPLV